MSSAELRLLIHSLIEGINDSSTLQAVYTLLAKTSDAKDDWGKNLDPAVKKRLLKSIKQLEKNQVIGHNAITLDLKKKYPHLKF